MIRAGLRSRTSKVESTLYLYHHNNHNRILYNNNNTNSITRNRSIVSKTSIDTIIVSTQQQQQHRRRVPLNYIQQRSLIPIIVSSSQSSAVSTQYQSKQFTSLTSTSSTDPLFLSTCSHQFTSSTASIPTVSSIRTSNYQRRQQFTQLKSTSLFSTTSAYGPVSGSNNNSNMKHLISNRTVSTTVTTTTTTTPSAGAVCRCRRTTGSGGNGSGTFAPLVVMLTTAFFLTIQPSPTRTVCYAEKMNRNSWSRLFSSATTTDTEGTTTTTPNQDEQQQQQHLHPDTNKACSYYGCIMRPVDVHYHTNEQMTKAFETLRSEKRTKLLSSDAMRLLSSQHVATSESVTLTLIGYKGGAMQDQINQDRSIIVSPYSIVQTDSSLSSSSATAAGDEKDSSTVDNVINKKFLHCNRALIGVFDGHAPLGEQVSEYSSSTLPELLAKKLYEKSQRNDNNNDEIVITKEALEETFVELDKTAPAAVSGGCTATVVLQQGRYIFIANAGDSRSFVITYRPSTNTSTVVAISREDKPSLPDERSRVEAMGGQVYIPIRGTSRVVYHDPNTGAPTGLAMSRSIGDWDAGRLGVIPNPLIQVLNIDDIVKEQLSNDAKNPVKFTNQAIVDATGKVTTTTTTSSSSKDTTRTGSDHHNDDDDDDVYVFAVCASDGMMDYLNATEIGQVLGHALYAEDGAHPVAAAEHLILNAASLWYHSKQGRYRDDIAIAVTTLRKPPSLAISKL